MFSIYKIVTWLVTCRPLKLEFFKLFRPTTEFASLLEGRVTKIRIILKGIPSLVEAGVS